MLKMYGISTIGVRQGGEETTALPPPEKEWIMEFYIIHKSLSIRAKT